MTLGASFAAVYAGFIEYNQYVKTVITKIAKRIEKSTYSYDKPEGFITRNDVNKVLQRSTHRRSEMDTFVVFGPRVQESQRQLSHCS